MGQVKLKIVGNFKDGIFRLETEKGERIENVTVLDWKVLDPFNVVNGAIAFKIAFLPEDIKHERRES